MPDVFADITRASPQALESIANVLELRAAIPQQQQMLRAYLQDIEFPDRSKVLEVGCGTGAIARAIAAGPRVAEVIGVDPSPALLERARSLASGVAGLTFETGDGRALAFRDQTFDVVILHTVLAHVPGPEGILAEAHRVLRRDGWLAVCDGDFATATLATGEGDPLEACVAAFVEGFVHDRWIVRRVSRLALDAAFEVSPLRSHGLVESTTPALTLTWVDRGADALAGQGRIGQDLAVALKAEARRRTTGHTFFGYMAYASLVGRRRS